MRKPVTGRGIGRPAVWGLAAIGLTAILVFVMTIGRLTDRPVGASGEQVRVTASPTAAFPNPLPRLHSILPTGSVPDNGLSLGQGVTPVPLTALPDFRITTVTPLPPPAQLPSAQLGPPVTITHIVRAGETIDQIATTYNVSVSAILAANGLTDPNRIFADQSLVVPGVEATLTAADLTLAPFAPPPTPTLLPPPLPVALNGLPLDELIIMPEAVRDHIREIYVRGQQLGNDSHAFSVVGDSTSEYPYFLARFDSPGGYNLGNYGRLQDVIDAFAGSFDRESLAVQRGMNTWSVFDPLWADPERCHLPEGPLACELRLNRPAVVFIQLGTNDPATDQFEENLGAIVQYAIDNGVIPLPGTKADRFRDPDNAVNATIRRVAEAYAVPLWDYDRVADTLPDRGLTVDGIHMTMFASHDYTDPSAFEQGYTVYNLLALLALDAVWQEAIQPVEAGLSTQ